MEPSVVGTCCEKVAGLLRMAWMSWPVRLGFACVIRATTPDTCATVTEFQPFGDGTEMVTAEDASAGMDSPEAVTPLGYVACGPLSGESTTMMPASFTACCTTGSFQFSGA